jgi:hypothetical protein
LAMYEVSLTTVIKWAMIQFQPPPPCAFTGNAETTVHVTEGAEGCAISYT